MTHIKIPDVFTYFLSVIDDDNRFFLGNVFGNNFNTFQLIWLMDSNNEILKLDAGIPDQFITSFYELIKCFLNLLKLSGIWQVERLCFKKNYSWQRWNNHLEIYTFP